MDLKSSKYPPFSSSHGGVAGVRKDQKPFNLKESPNNKRNHHVVEAPSTPGRPVFSFSVGNNVSRKNLVPSKWNNAEKWLISDHDSTTTHHQQLLHGFVKPADFVPKKSSSSNSTTTNGVGIKQHQFISGEKVEKEVSIHHNSLRPFSDKFTDEVESKYECLEPLSEGFVFRDPSMVDGGVKSRDMGTEMTPLGSSTTSRCPTPFKSLSPPRHNTPTPCSSSRSGGGSSLDIGELHLAKLKLQTPILFDWSSREEEEEDVSKSLRHFEINNNQCRKSISEPTPCANWEQQLEHKTNCCLRYQREEAKIQAWVDLQNAKAEAQSRKLEVKIQKMRSNVEEKVMRKMAIVHRKAEELRAAAQLEHTEQIQKASEQAKKTMDQHLSMHFTGHNSSCGCFPCNNLHP